MQKRELGQIHRTAVVCIDDYDQGVMQGRFFHPCLEGPLKFCSLCQLLGDLERTLDETAFPQGFNAVRTFAKAEAPPVIQLAEGGLQGRMATFSVRILFRQNASWQGSVRWLEEDREQSFRSALELIFLMDSALSGAEVSEAG